MGDKNTSIHFQVWAIYRGQQGLLFPTDFPMGAGCGAGGGWGLKSATGQLMTEEGDTEVAKSTPASSVPAASINPPKNPQKVKRRPKWQKVHLQNAPVKTKGLDARFQGRRRCNNARLVWPWSRPRDPWLGGTSQLTLCCNNYKAGLWQDVIVLWPIGQWCDHACSVWGGSLIHVGVVKESNSGLKK